MSMKKSKQIITLYLSILHIILLIFTPTVVFAEETNAVLAEAALIVDATNNRILYQQNAFTPLPPASTVKILTGLLVCEAQATGAFEWTDKITASPEALKNIAWDASRLNVPIEEGETLTVMQYLYCALIRSDTYSCRVLSHLVAGSVSGFVDKMNARAKELGCLDSYFTNATGYPEGEMLSTAWDLYLITQEAMKYPVFEEIVSTASCTIPATNKNEARTLTNSNWLLAMPKNTKTVYNDDYTYPDCIGIKTGQTTQAGSCLVAGAQRRGTRIYTVILGGKNVLLEDQTVERQAFTETIRMMNWAFFSDGVTPLAVRKQVDLYAYVGYMLVKNGSEGDAVRRLQQALKEQEYYDGAIDGSFGQQTENAVYAFQEANGLTMDGIAGKGTQNVLYGTSY